MMERVFGSNMDKGGFMEFVHVPRRGTVLTGILVTPGAELSLAIEGATELSYSRLASTDGRGTAPDRRAMCVEHVFRGVVRGAIRNTGEVRTVSVYFVVEDTKGGSE